MLYSKNFEIYYHKENVILLCKTVQYTKNAFKEKPKTSTPKCSYSNLAGKCLKKRNKIQKKKVIDIYQYNYSANNHSK